MEFRTVIEKLHTDFAIDHDCRIVMLGSCFTDEIGSRLEHDGFNVVHNPMGPLYNPSSIARILTRIGKPYGPEDLYCDSNGTWHCLDFASRYSGADKQSLLDSLNDDFLSLSDALQSADTIIITFGTAQVYTHISGNCPVGNCHRLPASEFSRIVLEPEEIINKWVGLLPKDKKVILTISPIRYTSDGLAENSLSKAVLRVAVNQICRVCNYDYFPAYEILVDDLRDYRFYAADMKHPSEIAVEYVYDIFSQTYFSESTRNKARIANKEYRRSCHNPNYRQEK